jgi:hypothetical protein
MSASSISTASLLATCLAVSVAPGANASGHAWHPGQQQVVILPSAHAGIVQHPRWGAVTVLPAQQMVLTGPRCDTVPPRGRRFKPGGAYQGFSNPSAHFGQGRFPRSHFGGFHPGLQRHEAVPAWGGARVDIRLR